MKGITRINRILFPTDFSDESAKAISTAIDLAEKHDAELIFLYAFRLIKEQDNTTKDIGGLKASLELEAIQEFKKLQESKLNTSLIKTSFLSEVGFLSDRLKSTIENRAIDLTVISASIEKSLNKEMKNRKDFKINTYFDCEVLLISAKT